MYKRREEEEKGEVKNEEEKGKLGEEWRMI